MDRIKTKFITQAEIPLVVEPIDKKMPLSELLNLLNHENAFFKNKLLKYGGLLFRNFPINSDNDFALVIKHLNTGNFIDYIGGDSPRKKVKDGIYTSTEAPPSVKIPLHNELSFTKNYPKHIYFYCEIAPVDRGETIIGDARRIYQSVDSEVMQRFVKKKLKYTSCYFYQSKLMNLINKWQPCHKSWMDVFETKYKHEVEKKCSENEFALKWNKNGWVQISQVRPATMAHPKTHEMVWFNQAHLFDFNPKLLGWWRYLGAKIVYSPKHMRLHEVHFSDNTKIPRSDFYHIYQVLDDNTIAFPWQKGDVLVLDNILAMHGRATFTGKRRVLAAMTG